MQMSNYYNATGKIQIVSTAFSKHFISGFHRFMLAKIQNFILNFGFVHNGIFQSFCREKRCDSADNQNQKYAC